MGQEADVHCHPSVSFGRIHEQVRKFVPDGHADEHAHPRLLDDQGADGPQALVRIGQPGRREDAGLVRLVEPARGVQRLVEDALELRSAVGHEPLGRLDEAQRLVAGAAPQLQGILNQALDSADWFGAAHQAEVLKAVGIADPDERMRAVRTLIAEETGVSMLIGVAVGYELANLLMDPTEGD